MVEVTPEEFDEAVRVALDGVPPALMDMLDNVAFFVEEEPPNDQPDDLLGIYEGVPLTDRDLGWGAGSLPDRIAQKALEKLLFHRRNHAHGSGRGLSHGDKTKKRRHCKPCSGLTPKW